MRRSVPEGGTENQSVVSRWTLVVSQSWLTMNGAFCPHVRRRNEISSAAGRCAANDERLMANDSARREFFRLLQNCVDTAFILPQYLVLRTLPVPQVGWRFAIGSRS